VLWFDECYDENYYRFDSSIRKAEETDLLLVVGTSGATNLPLQIGKRVMEHNGAVIDINPDENPFAEMARKAECGMHVAEKSAKILPQIIERLVTI
jgi:NAD-dependent deacetylase